ncbi:hypothetical protein SAMN02745121_05874 [Nannocystis exedens]|uniref:Uncharacterized protein n=1 Tax=Nannocystis exedens TaxID=54 RepID=A0A1I2E2D3_9BACT|nr:hypothetical protein NAEX_02251 [Nannocystis exedens]SFE86849.1 hypothetical protein SAMN02745121_05874 [Nannocystis exedens]
MNVVLAACDVDDVSGNETATGGEIRLGFAGSLFAPRPPRSGRAVRHDPAPAARAGPAFASDPRP